MILTVESQDHRLHPGS